MIVIQCRLVSVVGQNRVSFAAFSRQPIYVLQYALSTLALDIVC